MTYSLDHPFDVRTLTSRRPTPKEYTFTKAKVSLEEVHLDITDKEEITNINELLERFYKLYASNVLFQSLSYLVAQADIGFKLLKCTDEGALLTSPVGGGYDRDEVKSGNAPDSYGSAIAFSQKCTRIDILTWDYPCIFKRSRDGVTWDDEFEIPADFFLSIDCDTLQFNIKNKTAGQTCRYQVIGWYKDA